MSLRQMPSGCLVIGVCMIGAAYRLQATADGRAQSLAIDGTDVGQVPAAGPAGTAVAPVAVANRGTRPGSAVVSGFAFRPLRPAAVAAGSAAAGANRLAGSG